MKHDSESSQIKKIKVRNMQLRFKSSLFYISMMYFLKRTDSETNVHNLREFGALRIQTSRSPVTVGSEGSRSGLKTRI